MIMKYLTGGVTLSTLDPRRLVRYTARNTGALLHITGWVSSGLECSHQIQTKLCSNITQFTNMLTLVTTGGWDSRIGKYDIPSLREGKKNLQTWFVL